MHRISERKPEGKGLLGRPRCKWVDNIEIDLVGIGWGGVGRIRVAHDRQVESSCECDNHS
jgi:hypothetical protein